MISLTQEEYYKVFGIPRQEMTLFEMIMYDAKQMEKDMDKMADFLEGGWRKCGSSE